MIFHELYSTYYQAVAAVLSRLQDGSADEKELQQMIAPLAFGESTQNILHALKNGDWQLMRPDFTTPISHKPTLPPTNLQKRWLKAISLDKRIRLFDVQFEGLDDVEPLFTEDDYLVFDRYADGDPYDDPAYIARFHLILQALCKQKQIILTLHTRHGRRVVCRCLPTKLEYSEKDDKFRLITSGCRYVSVVKLASIESVELTEVQSRANRRPPTQQCEVCLRIKNERNALERCMMHFSHFQKQAEQIDRNHYLVRIRYDHDVESELVIRVLSFGQMVEVTEPASFRQLIISKLQKQANYF